MTFDDMVPLIRALTVAREAKTRAEARLAVAEMDLALPYQQTARHEFELAQAAWWTAVTDCEEGWKQLCGQHGMDRHELRMASL